MLKLTMVFKESKLNIDECDISGGIWGSVSFWLWSAFGAWHTGRQAVRGAFSKK